MSTRIIYRDERGRFVSKATAKRRRIRGKRINVIIPPRDDYGRFVTLPDPVPIPRPKPTPPPEPEPELIPASLLEELEELLEEFPELDMIDEEGIDEILTDPDAWYHGEYAAMDYIKHKKRRK